MLTASWCLGEFKVAVLEFLQEAHLVREKMSTSFQQSLVHDENLWVLMDYFATLLYKAKILKSQLCRDYTQKRYRGSHV